MCSVCPNGFDMCEFKSIYRTFYGTWCIICLSIKNKLLHKYLGCFFPFIMLGSLVIFLPPS